jgi:hypothetical protein
MDLSVQHFDRQRYALATADAQRDQTARMRRLR